MSEPFLGEIRMISWSYPPKNWAFCDGAQLPISRNTALYTLLGTRYGGNSSTFKLPDLRARTPMGFVPTQNDLGTLQGLPAIAIGPNQLPNHTHQFMGTKVAGTVGQPATGNYVGSYTQAFGNAGGNTNLDASNIGAVGNNDLHENRQPYLCISFIIALGGIFPTRN